MSLIGTFQNLVTENYNSFIFFSMREWAEFNKSCNLIGSGSGWNFLIRPAHGRRKPSLNCVSLFDDLKFPFFLHRLRLHTKVIFNTAFTIKRGASQQLKQVISERMGERKKKSYLPAKCRSV